MIGPLRKKVVVFAGGGTGGHLYPALAVARSLHGVEPVFVVPHDRGDQERLGGEFRCERMVCPRPDRGRLTFPGRFAVAVHRARRLLRELNASAVVGMGGYPSLPSTVAARLGRLPLYLMEVNAVPGKATRLLSRFAAGIGLGTERARDRLPGRAPVRVTGTPLRGELDAHGSDAQGNAEEFGLDRGRPTLLVLGGSQGATGLNDRVLAGLGDCGDLDFQVLHCSGPHDADRVRSGYRDLGLPHRVVEFLPDIGRAYAVSDLVLSRAGASTVAECVALRRPAVFVPYPWHKDRQQLHNAWDAVRAGAAEVVEEAELDPKMVRDIVSRILLDGERRQKMADAAATVARPDAARTMAAHILESFGPALRQPAWSGELGG